MNSTPATLADLNADELREMVTGLLQKVASNTEKIKADAEQIKFKQALIDKLTHEMAVLKRLKFAATSEKFCAGLSAEQKSLLEETLDGDLAAVAAEIEAMVRGAADDIGAGRTKGEYREAASRWLRHGMRCIRSRIQATRPIQDSRCC